MKLSSLVVDDKLILPVRSSEITNYIPHAKLITHEGRLIAVMPHRLEEAKILRNLGISTPSPILNQYKWKGRFLPFKHQRTTCDFITMNTRGYVLNGLGSGKTKAVLWSADYLMETHQIKRLLVICPVSVISVWEDEVFEVTPNIEVAVLMGTREARLKRLASGAPICVINFDGIATILPELLKAGFDMFVVDEGSDAYRNANTDRHKIARRLIGASSRFILMTATPTPKGPIDAYGLHKLMYPADRLSFTRWRDMVMRKTGPFKWLPKPDAEKSVYELLQPAVKFATEDCIDLPPLSYTYRQAKMGPDQQRTYNTMKRSKVVHVAGGQVTAANAAVLLTKLLQISLGMVRDEDGTARALDNANRLDTLLEAVHEAGDKAIVYVPYRASQAQVAEFLASNGLTVGVVNGDVNRTDRAEIFRDFQHGSMNVIVAHPRTASHGLNLTAASTVIWFGPTFSLEHFKQANARVARPGQQNHMLIVMIFATQVERQVYNALKNANDMLELIMSLFNNLNTYDQGD